MYYKNLREKKLIETEKLLKEGGLSIHPAVGKISLEGSRGLKGGFRDDSDIDISLILKKHIQVSEKLCADVINHSLSRWQSDIELDLSVIFDKLKCGLKCFGVNEYKPELCNRGTDCVGIYKIQKGFAGFIENMGLSIELMYPCLIIWEDNSGS